MTIDRLFDNIVSQKYSLGNCTLSTIRTIQLRFIDVKLITFVFLIYTPSSRVGPNLIPPIWKKETETDYRESLEFINPVLFAKIERL